MPLGNVERGSCGAPCSAGQTCPKGLPLSGASPRGPLSFSPRPNTPQNQLGSLSPRSSGSHPSGSGISPSQTPLDSVPILPVPAAWPRSSALPVPSAGSTSIASGTPAPRAPAWTVPLGIGPQPFCLLIFCLGRVSDSTQIESRPRRGLPGEDPSARTQEGLTPSPGHQVWQPWVCQGPPPQMMLPTQARGQGLPYGPEARLPPARLPSATLTTGIVPA